ncbi:MAG: hypothetical protein IKQ39_04990 [Oscillospiraceae bacterium]|nr:hypothetical protein [Oscillospiraceae bacterium]
MKRRTVIPALLLAALCCTGCGDKISKPDESSDIIIPEETEQYPELRVRDGQDARIVLENGTVLTVTDDGSIITVVENGLEWSYLSGTCLITFPRDWDERFYVRGTTVYCRACFDKTEYTGELFTIDFVDAEQLVDPTRHYGALIGSLRDFYAVIVLPEGDTYDTTDPTLAAEYNKLVADLPKVFQSASCYDTKDFKSIDLSVYTPATEAGESKLYGCWSTNLADPAGYTPYTVFRSRDSAFGFHGASDALTFGTFLVNKNAANYVWNTENWGDVGLAFANGQAYRLTYSETEPMELEVEPLFDLGDDSDKFGLQKFYFDRDFQEIYPADSESTGVEVELGH